MSKIGISYSADTILLRTSYLFMMIAGIFLLSGHPKVTLGIAMIWIAIGIIRINCFKIDKF